MTDVDQGRTAERQVQAALPQLGRAERGDLVRVVRVLRDAFHPDRIYVFGSHARGTGRTGSDIDLLILVPHAGDYPHHLAQEAFRAIGPHLLALDIFFMSSGDFERRADIVASLPATVKREGKLLYAAS